MPWSCIAVKKPSVSVNEFALVSHLFDASISTCCWLRSYGCRLCKAFWDHCLLILLVYSSSVASSFSFAWNKSSGVYLSSAYTTAAWRGDIICLFKKYVWGSPTCLSCSWVTLVRPLPHICCGRVILSFAARGWWYLYLVSNVLVLVWGLPKSVDIHFTIPNLKAA
jgi:hypothetical protein